MKNITSQASLSSIAYEEVMNKGEFHQGGLNKLNFSRFECPSGSEHSKLGINLPSFALFKKKIYIYNPSYYHFRLAIRWPSLPLPYLFSMPEKI